MYVKNKQEIFTLTGSTLVLRQSTNLSMRLRQKMRDRVLRARLAQHLYDGYFYRLTEEIEFVLRLQIRVIDSNNDKEYLSDNQNLAFAERLGRGNR